MAFAAPACSGWQPLAPSPRLVLRGRSTFGHAPPRQERTYLSRTARAALAWMGTAIVKKKTSTALTTHVDLTIKKREKNFRKKYKLPDIRPDCDIEPIVDMGAAAHLAMKDRKDDPLPFDEVPPAYEAPQPEETVEEILASGHLERIEEEGAGSSARFKLHSTLERKELVEAAKSMGLMCKQPGDGSVVVWASSDEILYGAVPYNFEELGLHDDVVLGLMKWKPKPMEKATHIQAEAIPKILKGRDCAIQAETGCGKTFAYLLPAAHRACVKADEMEVARKAAQELEDMEEHDPEDPNVATCYRVEEQAGRGIKVKRHPEEVASNTGHILRPGDEFMARRVVGSPLSFQFIEMADGRGWVMWDRRHPQHRWALSAREMKKGDRICAAMELTYGSGDKVPRMTHGEIVRLLPYVGVRWTRMNGVKAVAKPRVTLARRPGDKQSYWEKTSPDTIIITTSRELCEQTGRVARRLQQVLPRKSAKEFSVAVAVGAPPGVDRESKRKGVNKEQHWPFPSGDDQKPRVVICTLEFVAYFFHKKHIPLWAGVKYVVFDEVDRLVDGPEKRMLERVKTMFLRARRTEGAAAQTILVTSTMPSQGGKCARLKIANWMPGALKTLPRPDLLHRNHPMLQQSWHLAPERFEDKTEHLMAYLMQYADRAPEVFGKRNRKRYPMVNQRVRAIPKLRLREKTIIYCNWSQTAVALAEVLATTYGIEGVGLSLAAAGSDARIERFRDMRSGKIQCMVTTDMFARGIDIPDVERVIQFEYSSNVVDHMHRIGRASRAGSRGYVLNMYDNSLHGGRLLAEAIQECGTRPLDALFSRRGGFRRGLQRTENFRQMLLMQGLPLPPHLQDQKEVPLLSEAIRDMEEEDRQNELDVPSFSKEMALPGRVLNKNIKKLQKQPIINEEQMFLREENGEENEEYEGSLFEDEEYADEVDMSSFEMTQEELEAEEKEFEAQNEEKDLDFFDLVSEMEEQMRKEDMLEDDEAEEEEDMPEEPVEKAK